MAEERDSQNIGHRVSLSSPYSLNYGMPSAGIVRGTGADWFGPLNPMHPVAPPDVRGRILDFQSGYNLGVRPKQENSANGTYTPVSFEMLRNFSDAYDLMRVIIETRKDQMARLSWNITTRGHVKSSEKAKFADRILEIEKFFLRPDKVHFWGDWLRLLLEDLLVLDAPTLFIRRTYGGDLYSLEPLDGGTIKRVIDDWGRTPLPPIAAYQQVLKGYPAVDYTTEELIYKPRNIRTHRVYGFSPVEQIIMTINIGLRRQTWQLQTFTEGNIPEALIGTPSTWTPDQIASFQNWFDAMLEGNTAERSRAKFVPGEISKGYVATEKGELFGQAEEWLARVVCYAFSVSPQPFLQMMNRATAETAQETAASEGLAPMMQWVKGVMDSIIMDLWGETDLEFEFLDEDELDPNIKSEILDRDTGNARMTINESRVASGLEPYPEPEFDRPMVKTSTGYVPVVLTPEEKAEKERMAAQIAGEKPPEDGEEGEDTPGSLSEVSPGDAAGAPGADIPPGSDDTEEVAEKGDLPFDLAKADGEPANVSEAEIADGGVNVERPFAAKREKLIKRLFSGIFEKAGKDVSKQVEELLKKRGLAKVDDEFDADDFLGAIDFGILLTAQDGLEEYLREVFEDSAKIALSVVGTSTGDNLVEQVYERAVVWARDQSANLVGANPDSPYAITDTTRHMLRGTIADGLADNLSASDIAENIRDAYAFSEERAELIAFTEITSANSEGALAGYKEAEEAGVKMGKSWLVKEDGCEICSGNAAQGTIPLDQDFSSGDAAPGAHPHCRCVLVPQVIAEKSHTFDELQKWYQGQAAQATEDAKISDVFPVDTSKRGDIWAASNAYTEEAVADRASGLLMYVSFDSVVATQDFVNWDKVSVYRDDPTKSGFSPTVYKEGDTYYLQDGHHRAVASKLEGNPGMTMSVIDKTLTPN